VSILYTAFADSSLPYLSLFLTHVSSPFRKVTVDYGLDALFLVPIVGIYWYVACEHKGTGTESSLGFVYGKSAGLAKVIRDWTTC
jgi:hypothetical protein